jgi:hydroxyacylglutathione hydrolase
MNLLALPAFTDNYIWMVHNGGRAVVIDPGQSAPVLDALDKHRLQLAAILVTHHHGDHTGGVSELLDATCTGSEAPKVYAPVEVKWPIACIRLHGSERLNLLGCTVQVMSTPGHTLGHLSYLLQTEGEAPVLFCGDTLFSAGCGRLFEGSAAQLHASLNQLKTLPTETRVCCAHEYTLANLRFANAVEPDNQRIRQHRLHCESLRAAGLPTLPSTMGLELEINPFLRCERAQAFSGLPDSIPKFVTAEAMFAALRQRKDHFQ